MPHGYYVYIVASRHGALYTGVTGYIEHRMWQLGRLA
jgi:predicted GIY-YIG superfamily endonuclease